MLRPGVRLTVFALVAAGVGIGQKVLSAKAGLVYFVLGRVSIAGSGPLATGAVKRQLNEGGILFSEAGRAEVLLNSGTVLRIGDRTRIRMDSVDLADTRISIEAGSAVVTVNELPKLVRVEIHIGGAVVAIKADGVYRFDADSNMDALRVFSGQAEVSSDDQSLKIVAKRGQAVRLQDLQVSRFDRKDSDVLQQWAATRGAPPPLIPLAPMMCYSEPKNMPEVKDWMNNCYKSDQALALQ
jgi:hypothetical protein